MNDRLISVLAIIMSLASIGLSAYNRLSRAEYTRTGCTAWSASGGIDGYTVYAAACDCTRCQPEGEPWQKP